MPPIRLFGQNDVLPAAGLTIALVVVFSEPVARLLDYARTIETTRGLQLIPALVILAVVFGFQQVWKRQEVRAAARVAEAGQREANERASDMERLVSLGEALARSLDADAIRAAAAAHFPLLVPGRGVWAMLRDGRAWTPILVVGDSSQADREAAALAVMGERTAAVAPDADVCFPIVAADVPRGAVGVSADPPLTPHQRNMMAAAATLLAVSLKNAELYHDAREDGARDALTGCVNRATAIDALETELRRARRTDTPLSLLMFDLDRFKAINDQFGHLCGDAVLAAVGARMRAVLRGGDLKCRYGGDEFLIALPDTPLSGATHVAEMLRRDFADHPLMWQDETIPISASVGVALADPQERDPLELIARADSGLYLAKQEGRNCVRSVALEQEVGVRS